MVFEGGFVVGVCGGFLGFECADFNSFAVGLDTSYPAGTMFVAADATVFGEGIFSFFAEDVALVLEVRGETKVRAAVVEGFMIGVVNEEILRGVDNEAVHKDAFAGFAFV